jgi:hypothetical protein
MVGQAMRTETILAKMRGTIRATDKDDCGG